MIFGRRRAADRAQQAQQSAQAPHDPQARPDQQLRAADGESSGLPAGVPTSGPTDHSHPDGRTGGLRITEGLLPIFGPAQVGDSTAPLRPASEAERSRDRALRTTLTRVVGADGKSYVVAVPDEPAAGTSPGYTTPS